MSINEDRSSKNWDVSAAEKILREKKDMPGALLPILHALQEKFGYIEPGFVSVIAKALNLSRAEVHGVISFYHDYRQTPPEKRVVRICRAEACQSMGGRGLEQHARKKSGGAYALEPVYCLGNCACAPSMMVGDKLHGRVTPEKFDALMGEET